MLRSNFAWLVVGLASIVGVPKFLSAQEPPDKNGIWIDLGFPIQQRSDGSPVKPLFAPLATDLDGEIRQLQSGPRAVWLPQGFFEHIPEIEPNRFYAYGTHRITVEGGEVEITGGSIKTRGGKVEIWRTGRVLGKLSLNTVGSLEHQLNLGILNQTSEAPSSENIFLPLLYFRLGEKISIEGGSTEIRVDAIKTKDAKVEIQRN